MPYLLGYDDLELWLDMQQDLKPAQIDLQTLITCLDDWAPSSGDDGDHDWPVIQGLMLLAARVLTDK